MRIKATELHRRLGDGGNILKSAAAADSAAAVLVGSARSASMRLLYNRLSRQAGCRSLSAAAPSSVDIISGQPGGAVRLTDGLLLPPRATSVFGF